MKGETCCFLGHRNIEETDELKMKLYERIEELITIQNVDKFIFGSKSRFNDLCYEMVTEMKKKYPHIQRIYVRAEHQYITDQYKNYLLTEYEDTYYPENLVGATKAAYVKRNREMIDISKFCVIYYLDDYVPNSRKSGTRLAFEYTTKKNKIIYRFP